MDRESNFPIIKQSTGLGRQGFTIIELAIVLGILLVLASLAIVSYFGFKEKAYTILAKRDLANFMKYENEYYDNNDGYLGDADDLLSNDSAHASDPELKKHFVGLEINEGVVIKIISPASTDFVAESSHNKSKIKYRYSNATKSFEEIQKESTWPN